MPLPSGEDLALLACARELIPVYVAGPVGADDSGRLDRVNAAIDIAEKLYQAGFEPRVPHLFHYWDKRHPHEYQAWMRLCFAMPLGCQALFRMPGASPGADREVGLALYLGIPVFYSLDQLTGRPEK